MTILGDNMQTYVEEGVGAMAFWISVIVLSDWIKLHLKLTLPLDFSNWFYSIV